MKRTSHLLPVARSLVVAASVTSVAAGVLPADHRRVGQPQASTRNEPIAAQLGSVAGRVVDDATGRSLVADVRATGAAGVRRVRTRTDGSFEIQALPPGTYLVEAVAPGYHDGAYGRLSAGAAPSAIDLGAGDRMTGLLIRLWPYATLAGQVRDEVGDPLVGVDVQLLGPGPGTRSDDIAPIASDKTDDRGMYRFGRLLPGEYRLVVPSTRITYPPEMADATLFEGRGWKLGEYRVDQLNGLPVGRQTSDRVPALVYPTTFHGEGAGITLEAGDERVADITVTPVASWTVAGVLDSPTSPAPFALMRLVAASGLRDSGHLSQRHDVAVTTAGLDGRFAFHGVPAGNYEVRAEYLPRAHVDASAGPAFALLMLDTAMGRLRAVAQGRSPYFTGRLSHPPEAATLCGATRLGVQGADVPVRLPMRPAARVSGHVRVDDAAPPDDFTELAASVRLVGVDGTDPDGGLPGWVTKSGEFSTYGSCPGRYLVRVVAALPAGWVVASAIYGGRDLLDEPLELEGEDVRDVTVTVTSRTTILSGLVMGGGQPDPDALVLVFPVDRAQWEYAGVSRRLAEARTSSKGRYAVAGLPPGRYYAVATGVSAGRHWRQPDALARLVTGAPIVTVRVGETTSLNLSTAK